MIPAKTSSRKAFTLAEVLVAVAIFVVAIFSILELVNQTLNTVRAIQRQTPDLGALAGRTLVEAPVPEGELETGITDPIDRDFGKNLGADLPIYPNAMWQREIFPLDETNGLYQASIFVEDEIVPKNKSIPSKFVEYELRFLMFRPDLAEAELGGGDSGTGSTGR
tara:strand:+ start:1499 stop:1993 length:495 start_codon:yes stop_codon:yes gene_type:complete